MALRSFLVFLFLTSAFVACASIKECTNIPTQLSSHTVRSQLMTTKNQTWKEEMLSHYHLSPTDETVWLGLLPRKLLHQESPVEQFDWAMLYRSMKGFAGINKLAGVDFLREVSLHDVRLDPDSLFGQAQQTNLEYLLMLDVDRLVWNFRNQAGLSAPGTPYGGWEGPNVELRGHFVGHYMSASAQMWASTHNDTLFNTMSLVVDVLYDCQKKIGTGYLSAFPSELFDRFEAIQPVWAPYYTIHKIMAGLLDQYLLAGNSKALEMVVWMAEYFGNRVKNVLQKYTIERHWRSINEETGGMNDVLYKLYSITNDQKHLVLAHLFDKPCFLGLLALQADSLSNFHSNTHIPIVVGAQMRYEVTGDPLFKEIGAFFMDIVNSSHSYATGGTSIGEFWYDPGRLANTLSSTESEESCTTYNMLKISRNLFRWTKETAYADYYERALTNGVLSIQRGREPGVMIYMLPQGPGQSKAQSHHGWGTKYDSFWCCYGTGIESFSKLGDSIYFEDKGVTPGLYIIQYVSSSFNWKYGGLMINQKIAPITSWNPYLQILLTISVNESNGQYSTLNLRIPSWTSQDGAAAVLNDQVLPLPEPGNFLSVTKRWTSNDKMTIKFPIHLRSEALKDDRPEYKSIQAILFGPYLLAGLTSGDWDIKGNITSISDWITPVPDSYNSQLISLAQECNNSLFIFSNSNGSLVMDNWPREGTNSVVHGTFRVFNGSDSQGRSFVIAEKDAETTTTFMLEPFDLPGMVVEHQGPQNSLKVSAPSGKDNLFKLVSGLNGKPNTVSIESSSQQGCFVSGGVDYSAGIRVQLACEDHSTDMTSFRQAASFMLLAGLRQHHPISFAAKGVRRNFVLEPLLSLKDENYTVYFNIQA